MGLEKAIKHNKEHREAYRDTKAFDKTTRNHGGDYWSKSNRTIQIQKENEKMDYGEKDE